MPSRRHLSTLLALLLPSTLAACDDGGRTREPTEPWTAAREVTLVQYETCQALETDLKKRAVEELDAMILNYQRWWGDDLAGGDGDGAPPADGEGASGDDGGGREEGTDYSGTNNQEDGVDEADMVKTDGYHVYLVNGNKLHVFDVPEFGQLEPAAEIDLEGYPYDLVLDAEAGKAAVFSFVSVTDLPEEHPLRELARREDATEAMPYRTYGLTKVSVFDVEDAAAPALDREVWVEGWYQTARRTEHSVRLVTSGNILVPGLDDFWSYAYDGSGNEVDWDEIRARAASRIAAAKLGDMMPRMYERRPDGEVSIRSLAGSACQEFYRPTDSAGRSTTTVLSFDITASELAVDADTVVSNWATVYASRDRLYLAEYAWDWWWGWSRLAPGEIYTPSTNIHAFDVSRPGRASYVGSGRVEGTLWDQFNLSEKDGRLRVAVTTNPWRMWAEGDDGTEEVPVSESHIYVLEERGGALETIGHLGGIAPEEQIFAARFVGDEAFLVTFLQIDPLFTIDLSDPTAPRVLGELEVPGFSTYLHPVNEDRLLAIGVGAPEDGWNVKVSLFDVSDRTAPALMDGEELQIEGWSWSEAQYDHHAFQYFAPKKMLAIPMSGYSYNEQTGGDWRWHSRLQLIGVDPDAGLELKGSIDHSRFFQGEQDWWYGADVRRSIFMGDFIYVISSRAITVNRLDDLGEVTAAELPAPEGAYWWW